jgi:magnesium-protoporphyrin O-methyltransferase
VFNDRAATRQLKRYRRKGPSRTTRLLLDHLQAAGVRGLTLLDIGGGVGAIQHRLLDAGASRATGVDASPAYLAVATEEADRRGHAARAEQHLGDFVEKASDLGEADIVTLDRVLCCYPAMEQLVRLSAERARKMYAVVFPRDDWWVRALLAVPNAFMRLTRNPFRVFVHPSMAVERTVLAEGLRRRYRKKTAIWQVVVYERP